MQKVQANLFCRIDDIAPSATVAVAEKAHQLKNRGVEIFDLTAGEPDFDTPSHVLEAGIKALREGQTHYVGSRGIPSLLKAISHKYEQEQRISYDPAKEVLVTAGGKMALYIATRATVSAGDEVLIPEPAWVSYGPVVQLAGGIPRPLPLEGKDNFTIHAGKLERLITPSTRVIMLNSPTNPTGRVLTQSEGEAIAAMAIQHDLIVIADEIYEYLLYDGHRHIGVAGLPGMRDRTIIINGLSKAYAMTGWRLGFATAPATIMDRMLKVQQHTITCAAAFTQIAAVAALQGSKTCLEKMLAAYTDRRNVLRQGLDAIAAISCQTPEGAFYAFPDISRTGLTSEAFCQDALERGGVVMTPGSAFGAAGEGYVRISFACKIATIEKAIKRLQKLY